MKLLQWVKRNWIMISLDTNPRKGGNPAIEKIIIIKFILIEGFRVFEEILLMRLKLETILRDIRSKIINR